MAQQIILKVDHLYFKFHEEDSCFFHDFSFTIELGKLYFIRGQNGAGKSTLLRLLQGHIESQEQVRGMIEIDGYQIGFNGTSQATSTYAFKAITMVPQKFDEMLADQLSFNQNLCLATMSRYPGLKGLPGHQAIPDFAQRFNIDMDKPVHVLSGGQRQVLAILMALQKNASVLLLDEPTAALDEKNAEMVMQFLSELVQLTKLAVVIICHDKELVLRYAKHGYFEIMVDRESSRRTLRLIE